MRRIGIAIFIVCFVSSMPCLAGKLHWDAAELYERCVASQLRRTEDGHKIELSAGTLIEDDGPAAGYSYKPNVETLNADKRLKKILFVDRPAARSATLLFARGGELKFELNGKPLAVDGPRKCGNYWQEYDFNPKRLRQGENALVIAGSGQLWIARDDQYAAGSLTRPRHPNRSARSTDGGKTWSDTKLGDGDNVDGEYYVRLHLDQHVPQGELQSSVLDAGNLRSDVIAPPIKSLGRLEIQLDLDTPAPDTVCELFVRSGTTFAVDKDNWSDWQPATLNKEHAALVDSLRGRFFQLRIMLKTEDPLASPRLRGVNIESTTETNPGWTAGVKVVSIDNPPLVRSSIPFRHEDSDHPALAQLREDYKLDEVVAGAKSEFEIITRLATWSSQRWPKLGHLGEAYPPWDAGEILKPHKDGTPVGGFCHQFNVVFLQACQSFGIRGRCVSIGPGNRTDRIRGGHEVVEVWSNDHRKWVYVDGNTAWYIADEESGEPLSLWELQREQFQAFAGEKPRALKAITLAETRHKWEGIESWPPFVELRLVPRSDFLTNEAPLPLNQGMRGWFWTGYHVSSDQQLPARKIYAHRVARRQDFEWSVNCVELYLEATETPGEVRVHVDAAMPNFAKLLAATDDRAPGEVSSMFTWQLHDGANALSVIPQNKSGRNGVASTIRLQHSGD